MKVGDIVIYTMEFDSDLSYTPNVGPSVIAKINQDGSLDLAVFALNGLFYKLSVQQGLPGVRQTWHEKE